MSDLKVDTAEMMRIGNNTVSNSEEFLSELTSLRNNIEGLFSVWRGTAANEFGKSYEGKAHVFDEFRVLLNDMGAFIDRSGGNYQDAEDENARAGANLFPGV